VTRLLLLTLCLLVPGCGADEPAPVRAKDDRIAVTVKDFRYEPQTISAQPGRPRVRLTNRGRLAHTFRVERKNTIVAKVSSLLPGDTAATRFRVREGEYRFFCALSNHEELGMYGTLIVR
jgi:plastocyanin